MDAYYLIPVSEYMEHPQKSSDFDQVNTKIVNNPYLSEYEKADALKVALNKLLNQQQQSKDDIRTIVKETVREEMLRQQAPPTTWPQPYAFAPPTWTQPAPPPTRPREDTFDVNTHNLNENFNNYFKNVKKDETEDEDDYQSASSEIPSTSQKTPRPQKWRTNSADVSEHNIITSGKVRATRTKPKLKGGWISRWWGKDRQVHATFGG